MNTEKDTREEISGEDISEVVQMLTLLCKKDAAKAYILAMAAVHILGIEVGVAAESSVVGLMKLLYNDQEISDQEKLGRIAALMAQEDSEAAVELLFNAIYKIEEHAGVN